MQPSVTILKQMIDALEPEQIQSYQRVVLTGKSDREVHPSATIRSDRRLVQPHSLIRDTVILGRKADAYSGRNFRRFLRLDQHTIGLINPDQLWMRQQRKLRLPFLLCH